MNQGFVHLDKVETFVLDEADRMLDMGFIHDVRRIAEKLPEKRQTLMFSATMPPEVEKLAMDLLHEPESVKVDPVSSTVKKIDQCLYYVDKANKKHLLAKILRDPDVENALVFSRTKHGADRIVRDLKREGIDAVAIHGDKSQNARQAALTAFKTGECKVLVATDIAARGHRHCGSEPRYQLRYADGETGNERPPHWAHGPRWPRRHRRSPSIPLHRRGGAVRAGGEAHWQASAAKESEWPMGNHHPQRTEDRASPARQN